MKKIIFAVLFLMLSVAIATAAGSGYMITFQTTDCNGDTGLVSVEINRIYKIETVECDPPHQDAKRKQVLINSKTLHGSYDVFTVDEKEAAIIQKQIQAYMNARRRLLENGTPIILHEEN